RPRPHQGTGTGVTAHAEIRSAKHEIRKDAPLGFFRISDSRSRISPDRGFGVKCQYCDSPATVHLTDIVNKKKREQHLCTKCARERNLIPEPPGAQQLDLKALLNML